MANGNFDLQDLWWSMGLGCVGGIGSFVWSKAVGSPISISIVGFAPELASFLSALVLGCVVAGITCSASGFNRGKDAGRFYSAALLAGLLWKPTAEMLQARIKNQPDFQAERHGQVASQLAKEGAPLPEIQKAALDTLDAMPRANADTRAEVTQDLARTVSAIENAIATPAEKAETLATIVQHAQRADSPQVGASAVEAMKRVTADPALRQKYQAVIEGVRGRQQ
jgi:hypothetical protein